MNVARRELRALCVLPHGSPLPLTSGAAIRAWNLLSALRSLGELDVVLLGAEPADRLQELSSALGGPRIAAIPTVRQWSVRRRVAWLMGSHLPVELYNQGFAQVRKTFDAFAAAHYDVVLFVRPICFAALRPSITGSAVFLDLDDIPDVWALRAISVLQRRWGKQRYRPGNAMRTILSRINARRWSTFVRKTARSDTWILVCSDDDRERLGAKRCDVIPNGYERVGPPLGRAEIANPPNILFPGRMTYLPNADGADYLVQAILPILRETVADAQCTIAGQVEALDRERWEREPGVSVSGFVPRMEDELARADIVVVPLRSGGGTRVKILEAFAHRIPVVSTTIGAEGLGVRSDRELLLADTPQAFADACVRLLADRALREALVTNAFDHYEREFRWDRIRARFVRIARDAAQSDEPSSENSTD
jgi:glycosyltransferase involved in cell wall biosynthesis